MKFLVAVFSEKSGLFIFQEPNIFSIWYSMNFQNPNIFGIRYSVKFYYSFQHCDQPSSSSDRSSQVWPRYKRAIGTVGRLSRVSLPNILWECRVRAQCSGHVPTVCPVLTHPSSHATLSFLNTDITCIGNERAKLKNNDIDEWSHTCPDPWSSFNKTKYFRPAVWWSNFDLFLSDCTLNILWVPSECSLSALKVLSESSWSHPTLSLYLDTNPT